MNQTEASTLSHSPFPCQPNLDVLKRIFQINQISSSCQKPSAGGETWCNQLYTVCVPVCESILHCEVEGEAAGSLRFGEVGRGASWMKARSSSKYLSYHAHTQCYRHISPDSYDEPSRFMQKIVSFLPTPLQLKWIFISVTSSSYPWYLPASHSSILHVYIPLVFPLFLPSFLSTRSPFLSL